MYYCTRQTARHPQGYSVTHFGRKVVIIGFRTPQILRTRNINVVIFLNNSPVILKIVSTVRSGTYQIGSGLQSVDHDDSALLSAVNVNRLVKDRLRNLRLLPESEIILRETFSQVLVLHTL